jgi:hypothetical protein
LAGRKVKREAVDKDTTSDTQKKGQLSFLCRYLLKMYLHGDNQSALAVSANGVKSERTKHVDVKYHFITETVESGQVKLQWVPTQQQEADIFTKPLAAPVFLQLRSRIMSQ